MHGPGAAQALQIIALLHAGTVTSAPAHYHQAYAALYLAAQGLPSMWKQSSYPSSCQPCTADGLVIDHGCHGV